MLFPSIAPSALKGTIDEAKTSGWVVGIEPATHSHGGM